MSKDQANSRNQGGSGSAENKGQDRQDQQAKTEFTEQEKQEITRDIGSGDVPVASLRDLGSLSGRDDASGGSGDDMENTSTGDPTDRF